MPPTCYTSITFNYLPKARALATSVKQLHPDWRFVVCLCDRPQNGAFDIEKEVFDDVIWCEDLEIENFHGWVFKHRLVEICTAVKGQVATKLLDEGCEKVIYFDPDMVAFNDLSVLENLLDKHPVVLVPHQTEPEDKDDTTAIADNEMSALKHGVFNLGFMAVNQSSEGRKFAHWWRDRLLAYCYAEIENGLFTDQKWCDLAPAFFPALHVWRHPGADVASWNLSHRNIKFDEDGRLLSNGEPLLFYHFSSFDTGMAEIMSERYSNDIAVFELMSWYRRQLDRMGQQEFGNQPWYYGNFDNGKAIPDEARVLYRKRLDLQYQFNNPFAVEEEPSYYRWWKQERGLQ